MNDYIIALEKILVLGDRIKDIEKKQAERFPHLIERLDRIEGSFPAIVDRLDRARLDLVRLEEKICRLTKTVYNIKKWTK